MKQKLNLLLTTFEDPIVSGLMGKKVTNAVFDLNIINYYNLIDFVD